MSYLFVDICLSEEQISYVCLNTDKDLLFCYREAYKPYQGLSLIGGAVTRPEEFLRKARKYYVNISKTHEYQ